MQDNNILQCFQQLNKIDYILCYILKSSFNMFSDRMSVLIGTHSYKSTHVTHNKESSIFSVLCNAFTDITTSNTIYSYSEVVLFIMRLWGVGAGWGMGNDGGWGVGMGWNISIDGDGVGELAWRMRMGINRDGDVDRDGMLQTTHPIRGGVITVVW